MRDTIWNDIKIYILQSGNTLNRLAALNIAIFILFGILWVILNLAGLDPGLYDSIRSIVSLPSDPYQFIQQPWTIITYQFIHSGFFHLLFNMLMLLFAGRIFQEYLGNQKLLANYILGGIAGGLVFFAAFNLIPAFGGAHPVLIGASASILAILTSVGTLLPDYIVNLVLIGPVRMVYVMLFFLVVDLLSLVSGNAGGHFAHLGGALWGFVYIKSLQNGYDLGGWLTKLFSYFNSLINPRRKITVQTTYQKRPAKPKTRKISEEEVDAILDKIAKSGYESLSDSEKDTLFRASKER